MAHWLYVCIIPIATCIGMVSSMRILDMSHVMDEWTPLWGPGVQHRPALTDLAEILNKTGHGRVNNFRTGEHVGTHLDAPVHVVVPGATQFLHEMPLENLYGTAVSIDVRDKINQSLDIVNYAITVEDILQHERKHGEIPGRAIVFSCTGWSENWNNTDRYWGGDPSDSATWNFPAFSAEAAKWLMKNRSIKGLAVDSPSCDPGNNTVGPNPLLVHKALFATNTWCLENVLHTCDLPQTPNKATVYLFPNKVRGGSGSPVRVVAFIGMLPEQFTAASKTSTYSLGLQGSLVTLILCIVLTAV